MMSTLWTDTHCVPQKQVLAILAFKKAPIKLSPVSERSMYTLKG